MKHAVDAVLRAEVRAFALRFACEDCVHFHAAREACVHGFTERPSLEDLAPGSPTLSFCKEFELGEGRDA